MKSLLSFNSPVLVFGGVYSNLQALQALLDEARRRGIGPRAMVCTGDIVAYGAGARACVDLIRQHGIAAIAGNCEEQLALEAVDCGCGYAEGSVYDTLAVSWYRHAQSEILGDDQRWMAQLPRRLDIEINGVQLAIVHGALDSINRFVFPSTPARIKAHDIDAAGCDGIIASHSGLPFSQVIGGRLWHNSGALGMPANDGTPRVWFSILKPGSKPRTLEIEHVALNYDAGGAAADMHKAGLPDAYAQTLTTGLWPSCESMPADEARLAGLAIESGTMKWDADAPRVAVQDAGVDLQWPLPQAKTARHPAKFSNPVLTAKGEKRASVTLDRLETLWINTGTLCNLSCASCYIESTPRNDRLVYISAQEVRAYLDEIERGDLGTSTIGFTGGEPFMNPDMAEMMDDALSRGLEVIVLTNAMKPMRRFERRLLALNARYRDKLIMRVSLDHYAQDLHELERGAGTWRPAMDGLRWLADNDFRVHIAGRSYSGETAGIVRAGYARLFQEIGLQTDAANPAELVIFPEMNMAVDVPEITDSCWGILHKSPADVMCASSRMIVKRKGAEKPAVIACTLLPYDAQFELGQTLADAARTVPLNHPYCAQFCVLGGAACKV